MCLATSLTTISIVCFVKLLLRANRKVKVSRRFHQAVMTLCMWIKSHIKADKAQYSKRRNAKTYQRRTQSRYCKRYYIRASKRRPARISSKTARYIVRKRLQAFSSQTSVPGLRRNGPQDVVFDSDSFIIQVDDGASRSISNNKSHFESIEPLKITDPHGVTGPSGKTVPIKGKGTLKWQIEDDDGVVHMITLKDSLYVPEFTSCLLCIQHWSQVTNDHWPQQDGTWQAHFSDRIIMYWDQRCF